MRKFEVFMLTIPYNKVEASSELANLIFFTHLEPYMGALQKSKEDREKYSLAKEFITHAVYRNLLPAEWLEFDRVLGNFGLSNDRDYHYDFCNLVMEWDGEILQKACNQMHYEFCKIDYKYVGAEMVIMHE